MNELKDKYRSSATQEAKAACSLSRLVKDKETKEPFEQAGKMVYQKAFAQRPCMGSVRSYPEDVSSDDNGRRHGS